MPDMSITGGLNLRRPPVLITAPSSLGGTLGCVGYEIRLSTRVVDRIRSFDPDGDCQPGEPRVGSQGPNAVHCIWRNPEQK